VSSSTKYNLSESRQLAASMTDDIIWIVTDEPPQVVVPDGARDGQRTRHPLDEDEPEIIELGRLYRIPVKAEKLEQNVAEFLRVIGRVVCRAQRSAGELGNMELDEIELAVEVNGEGQLSLLGSGGKVGGKGAMILKFKVAKP
jgi:hypothetical protein